MSNGLKCLALRLIKSHVDALTRTAVVPAPAFRLPKNMNELHVRRSDACLLNVQSLMLDTQYRFSKVALPRHLGIKDCRNYH